MSAGVLSFGGLPQLAGLSSDDLATLMQRFGAGQQANAPGGNGLLPALTQPDPGATGSLARPQPAVAMNEADVQRMERGMLPPGFGGEQQRASASPDLSRLFDTAGMGGGGGFSGTSGQIIPDPRLVPMPPQRPGDLSMPDPLATGSVPGRPSPGSSLGATPADVAGIPREKPPAELAREGPRPSPLAPGGASAPSSTMTPVNSFDPLTGQPVSGSPKPLGGPAQAVAQQPGFMERFAQGLGRPEVSDLMMNLAIGLMSQRGIGPALAAGFKGYQDSQRQGVTTDLARYKLAQQVQGQNATLAFLKSKGMNDAAAQAAMLNPTVLSSLLSQMNQKTPQQIQAEAEASARGSAIGGQQPLDRVQAEAQARAAGSAAGGLQPLDRIQAEAQARAQGTEAGTSPKDFSVRPGETRYDGETKKPIIQGAPAKPEGFETESKLRGEFSKQLNNFSDVHDGYGRVIAATRQREANPGTVSPASDIGLIFGYMKMLDPGSVVREGEYATAKNAAGIPERVLNAYNKALSGEFLSDTQRKDFLGQAAELYGTARKTAEGVADRYRGLAQQYGVDPSRAAYLPEAPTPPQLGQQPQGQPQNGGAAFRFQQLRRGGMSAADAYAKMHQEGL